MAVIGRDMAALAAAGLFAVVMPLALLLPGAAEPAPQSGPPAPPLGAPAMAPLAAAYERPLFAPAAGASDAAPADAPALLGIIGRLNEDAVALVKTADGTRALKIGDSVDGWSLASLAADAAFFTRGTERVRVAMPAGGDEAPAN